MSQESYQYMKELVEKVREPLLEKLDEREKILLDSYFHNKGDLFTVAQELGISIPQASRLLRRVQFKAQSLPIETNS